MKVKDIYTGKVHTWTVKQMLHEINRDRSNGWIDYDKTDWLEGWTEFCEGDCYTLIVKKKTLDK